MHYQAAVAPEILTQALAYTTGAFGSFSAVALFSQRRSFLFLGGIISTMMTTLFLYSLMGMFMGSNPLGIGYLFITLFVACIYIIFDT
jgi:FtsH-binding integral membrane protein